MPIVNFVVYQIVGDKPLSEITTVLRAVYVLDSDGKATNTLDNAKSIIINWGNLIQTVIDFLLIALVLFTILKVYNTVKEKRKMLIEKLKKQEEVVEPAAPEVPAAPPAPTTNELLGEIIDILKGQNNQEKPKE